MYDIRIGLGLSVAELALQADLADDGIERIEEGGTEPTIPLLRHLAAALDADIILRLQPVPRKHVIDAEVQH